MTNINQETWTFLDNNPIILRALNMGIVNKRALANYIIKMQKFDTNINAVISAIRRYNIKQYDEIFDQAHEILQNIEDISTRTNMVIITIGKDGNIFKYLPELLNIIKHEKGELLRVVHANVTIKIIVNKKNLQKIKELIPKNNILLIEEVAEINIQFNIRADQGPGPIAMLTNELALHEVSIIEMLTCFPETIIYVFKDDLIKGYRALQKLCSS